jgi:hypothetical protein
MGLHGPLQGYLLPLPIDSLLSVTAHSHVHTRILLFGELRVFLRPRELCWREILLLLVPPKSRSTKGESLIIYSLLVLQAGGGQRIGKPPTVKIIITPKLQHGNSDGSSKRIFPLEAGIACDLIHIFRRRKS